MERIPDNILEFLSESNRIENIQIPKMLFEEYYQDPLAKVEQDSDKHARNSVRGLLAAVEYCNQPLTSEIICKLHQIQMEGLLDNRYVGKYRKCRVYVGGDTCPEPNEVPKLIGQFLRSYNKKTAHELKLHCEFETIHPFIDGNGRTGRLIYLMDLLRRGKPIQSILAQFRLDDVPDFFEDRRRYYDSIRFYKHLTTLIKLKIN